MKSLFTSFLLVISSFTVVLAQADRKKPNHFKLFNQTSLSYTFGLNETFPGDKSNATHVKTVVGFASSQAGFGIGLETASFRSDNSSQGASFNTLAFTGNLHVLAKPITDDGINFFLKGGAGYAPKIFRSYDKGFTYEAATGAMITTKRGSRYFLQGIYHYQEINNFILSSGKISVKSIGVGIGTWF